MAKLNVKKLIGAFNNYLKSGSTKSFADYMATTKVGFFAKNSHVDISKLKGQQKKYEEFLNYLIENDKKYNGDKYKAIAIRQIRAEFHENKKDGEKLTINNIEKELNDILARSPVPSDNWHTTKYVIRKTGKTALVTTISTVVGGAFLGLVLGWGVGWFPGMTGNIARNIPNAMLYGSICGMILGPTIYGLTYAAQKSAIKKLGKKDKENLSKLQKLTLNSTKELENLNIPLMTLVHDFREARQVSKELRTSKNPFNILKHRRKRDLNYIRFEEITESFGQLIDSLEKSGKIKNAHIVKEYYCKNFESLFYHPDFGRIANKFSIDKKLTNEAITSSKVSDKEISNRINNCDLNANKMIFNYEVKKGYIPSKATVKPSTTNGTTNKPTITTNKPAIKPTVTKPTSTTKPANITKRATTTAKPSTTTNKPTVTTNKPVTTSTTTIKPNRVEVILRDKEESNPEQLIIPGMENYINSTKTQPKKKINTTTQKKSNKDTFMVEVKVVDSFTNND